MKEQEHQEIEWIKRYSFDYMNILEEKGNLNKRQIHRILAKRWNRSYEFVKLVAIEEAEYVQPTTGTK